MTQKANSESVKLILIRVVQNLIGFPYRMEFERLNQPLRLSTVSIIICTKLENQILANRILKSLRTHSFIFHYKWMCLMQNSSVKQRSKHLKD